MAAKKTEINYTQDELAEIDRIVKIVTGETTVLPARDIRPSIRAIPQEEAGAEAAEEEMFAEEEEVSRPGEEPIVVEDLHADKDLFPEEAESIGEEEYEDITESITEAAAGKPSEAEEITRLSDSDISFIEEEEPAEARKPVTGEFEEFEEFDLTGGEKPAAGEKAPEAISIEAEEEMNIPDFDRISPEEEIELPEASEQDIPEVDFEALVSGEEAGGSSDIGEAEEEIGHEELQFDEFEKEIEAPESETRSTMDEFDEFSSESFLEEETPPAKKQQPKAELPLEGMEDFSDIESPAIEHDLSAPDTGRGPAREEEETLTIEPLEEEFEPGPAPSKKPERKTGGEEPAGGIELTDRDLAKLKKAIILFNPAVRHVIRDVIINDLMSQADTQKLVDMIVTGKPEENIQKYLEKKLKIKIDLVDESGLRRRVITQRPEYTLEGRERQKKLLKLTRVFSVAAIAGLIITILSYQFIYKPFMAKRLIHRGVEIIISSGLEGNRFDRKSRYAEAERLFSEVNEEYVKDYLYGYNEYARAYLKNRDYQDALRKLNDAYNIDRTNIDTLNNLGYFYAKIDKTYYPSLKPSVPQWYFGGKMEPASMETNLDLAITFFRRALLVDDENITALVGIGNAYYLQGEYLKAKKYYEDILKVDPDSVAGYSGLLNLYIERDSFPLVATLHAELREKDMLEELPSPLLSKLAGYYLDKRRKGDSSIRIDYGVTTPKLKDESDNTYPAVLEVLKALNSKDPDYPQLHIQFARLNQAQDNLAAMKRYLDRALELSPKYFSALNLMGEYYYNTNDPVNAYKYLKSAADNYPLQPGFTQDDFYRETESIGKTYSCLGNIFYYYFDKIKSRTGGLEDEIPDQEREKMENYTTAQFYYEKAFNNNFNSQELNYNLGRIYYLKGQNAFALERWLLLYDDFIQSPELMLPLGNAFYKNGNYDAAKGEFLKMIYVMEYEADKYSNPDFSRRENVKLFQSLATGYNNLGAVYQMLGEYDKRDLAYWKAIEYSQRMGKENEYARTNLARAHREAEPYIDDSIPFSIDYYMADWRK